MVQTIVKICIFAINLIKIKEMIFMKRLCVLGCLLVCCLGWMRAQTVETDSLIQTVVLPDSTQIIVADSVKMVADSISPAVADTLSLVAADSLSVAADSIAITDSITYNFRLQPIDSTALIMEKVKAVTDMISARALLDAQMVKEVFSDTAIVNKYNRLLDKMVREYDSEVAAVAGEDSTHFNSYFFRLFAPLTLYKTPVSRAMQVKPSVAIDEEDSIRQALMVSGRDLRLLQELDRVLLNIYLTSPDRVLMTEDSLRANQSVSVEVIKGSTDNVKLDVPVNITLPQGDGEKAAIATDMVVHKPNFWRTKGAFSTQMTESFFSPNWYQGGTNNINVLSTMRLEANYNNKKKIQWDNKLEARIGFYQNQGAEIQSNQDMLRMTSKLNLKAVRSWNYTIEAQGETQMMQHFNGDNTLKSRFMTPFNGSLTVGMDFKKNFKNGSVSIFPGPLSYKMTYVAIKDKAPSYGVEKGRVRNDIGSKLEVNFNYNITKNISYRTRFYYYTPYDYVQMDWENTFNFQVSKYISTTLFFHTRFDDHVARNDDWGFFQFKEYLTFGLNYSW